MDRTIKILTIGQLAASALTFACLLFYPGIMVVITGSAGLVYLIAAYYAHKQSRPAIWVAFLLSTGALWATAQMVQRWLTSRYFELDNIATWPIETLVAPLLVTTTFVLLLAVVLLHLWCWRWLVCSHVLAFQDASD